LENLMTDFNCECSDTNDNLTLDEYRTRMMQRLGFSAISATPPPGMEGMLTTFLQDAQDFLYLKYPALRTRRFFRWTTIENERFYGIRDNDETWTEVDVTLTGTAPGVVYFPGTPPTDGQRIQFWPGDDALPAELTAYQHYYVVNSNPDYGTCEVSATEDGDSIDFTTGGDVHASHTPANSACIFNMQQYADIEGAWIVDLNGMWLPMVQGIPPVFYTTSMQPSIPTRFEIRQCIEIFPAPNVGGYQLYLKGHFGKAAFSEDDDKPTIDGQLVYLWALANALDYYGKPSASGVAEQAREHLGSLVAGTHGAKRYVPGVRPLPPAVMPLWTPYYGNGSV
jgi:hypothetical protein